MFYLAMDLEGERLQTTKSWCSPIRAEHGSESKQIEEINHLLYVQTLKVNLLFIVTSVDRKRSR